jgi:hypothetical protein
MSLILLLNPKQFGGASPDTSDILDRYAKRRKREEQQVEEAIAAQLLQARQQDIVIPDKINKLKLGQILGQKVHQPAQQGEVTGAERTRRIHVILLLLALDEHDEI